MKDTREAIKNEINTAFQKVIDLINPQATREIIENVISLCIFFFKSDGVKDKINKTVKDIEKVCLERLKVIPKDIAQQYTVTNCKEFDSSFKAFSVFHAFYQSFVP